MKVIEKKEKPEKKKTLRRTVREPKKKALNGNPEKSLSPGRIELHAHSKSGGDATMYAGELIRYASERNMPAVAITDRSSILAFPEMESVCRWGDYTAKPIYGTELSVREKDSEEAFTLTLLVRNDTGKENLYRLYSEARVVSPEPVADPEMLEQFREGLLIGSGGREGKLRRLAQDGASDRELKEIIAKLDYVELLPYESDRKINERLLLLCEAEGKPAVAISDAHFLEKKDKKAWCALVDKCVNSQGIHLYSTDEMLAAFSYLAPEKAQEIVIANPQRIADLCGSVHINPEKRCYPVIDDVTERIGKLCREALPGKYEENEKEEALRFLDKELEALEKTQLGFHILQTKELMERAGLRACDVSFRGTSAGSVVLYLLGMTEIDPLKYQLSPETIYGINGTKQIDIDLNVPRELLSKVHRQMGTLEGIGAALPVGCTDTISQAQADEITEMFVSGEHDKIPDAERERISGKIIGNVQKRIAHPGGVILFPKNCDPVKLMPAERLADGSLVTAFDHYCFDHLFKADVLGLSWLDMLRCLSERTGTDVADVPVCSEEAMAFFRPDENGEVTGCADIPGFDSEWERKMISVLRPADFGDMVKVSGLSHSSGTWEKNAETLVKEQGVTIRDLIAFRDDVFDDMIVKGFTREEAFTISELVRKGKAKHRTTEWMKQKKEMKEKGVAEWYIRSCESIAYLFPRAHAVSYTMMTMRLAWYKAHFPAEYAAVIAEYMD